jgi:response regulator of citrate/malate metabolism
MSSAELTVLIVDDDFRVASVHEGFVERVPGFRVVGKAYTAAEALEQARLTRPDVVLMDVYLPDGDGLQVIRQLLEEPDAPIVLVVSAATEVATVRRAVQLGAVHYLVKPFGFAALAERLTAIRNAQAHFDDWPEEPTQEDISRIYDLLRPERTGAGAGRPEDSRLAPTLRLVYGAIASSRRSLSASEIAATVGISRATAQRYLAQLEQSRLIKLELRYGATGRPEHRYSTVPR